MNPWPFIIGAYGFGGLSTLCLLLWTYIAMRRAEAAADALRREL
ncbi:MAG: Heme exporter protein [Alphaproteobacteria bacterium]|nr:Heme exporter protein [Alphaproteobacteria bacterium]